MGVRYSFQNYDPKTMARGFIKDLPISFKHAYELAKYIRGRKVTEAIRILEEVIALKRPVPFTRYNRDVPHRRGEGFGPGRYPVKAAKYFLKAIKSVLANAKQKGLSEEDLYIIHLASHKGVSKEKMRIYGKSVHLEIVLGPKPEGEEK